MANMFFRKRFYVKMGKIKKYLQSYDFNLSKNEKLVKDYLIKSNEPQISSKKLSKKLFIPQSTVSSYLNKIGIGH